jgi:hypothetical protein
VGLRCGSSRAALWRTRHAMKENWVIRAACSGGCASFITTAFEHKRRCFQPTPFWNIHLQKRLIDSWDRTRGN